LVATRKLDDRFDIVPNDKVKLVVCIRVVLATLNGERDVRRRE